jgi:hypothetical protein
MTPTGQCTILWIHGMYETLHPSGHLIALRLSQSQKSDHHLPILIGNTILKLASSSQRSNRVHNHTATRFEAIEAFSTARPSAESNLITKMASNQNIAVSFLQKLASLTPHRQACCFSGRSYKSNPQMATQPQRHQRLIHMSQAVLWEKNERKSVSHTYSSRGCLRAISEGKKQA